MEDKLLKLLYEEQLITQDEYQKVAQECEQSGVCAQIALEKLGILAPENLVQFLSKKFRMPVVDWEQSAPDQETLQLIPKTLAAQKMVFPLALEKGKRRRKMTLAIADPSDVAMLDDISFRTGCVVKTELASVQAIRQAIHQYYGANEAGPSTPDVKSEYLRSTYWQGSQARASEHVRPTGIDEFDGLLANLRPGIDLPDEEPDVLTTLDQEHPATKYLVEMMQLALERGSSEIHLVPSHQGQYRVQFGLDGQFHEHAQIPDQIGRGIAARLRRIATRPEQPTLSKKAPPPWHGRFVTSLIQDKLLTILVNFYPNHYGNERILLKLSENTAAILLDQLGFEAKTLKTLNRLLARPDGLLLVVSPPGQGKTTTLRAMTQQFCQADMHVITVAHPESPPLDGVTQLSAHLPISRSEWHSLIAYNAPDLIVLEHLVHNPVAPLAFEFAAGTLVLCSLTARDLTDGLYTFLTLMQSERLSAGNIQAERQETALDLLNGVVAQRLARTLCPHCREQVPLSDQDAGFIRWLRPNGTPEDFPVYTAKGCPDCLETGYQGQTAIFEVLKLDKHLRQSWSNEPPISAFQLRRSLSDMLLDTLKRQALGKLREGVTSPQEIRRTVFRK